MPISITIHDATKTLDYMFDKKPKNFFHQILSFLWNGHNKRLQARQLTKPKPTRTILNQNEPKLLFETRHCNSYITSKDMLHARDIFSLPFLDLFKLIFISTLKIYPNLLFFSMRLWGESNPRPIIMSQTTKPLDKRGMSCQKSDFNPE